ncbi:MAG: PAS domain S-box protein [Spirochaetes bacterium]|nr:PAS domain S-box protein [Spirochaetota bacterium]
MLIVHSYNEDYSWSAAMNATIKADLREDFPDIEISVEYLDAKRYELEEVASTFLSLLTAKYADADLDAVAVTDNPAFELLLESKERIFGDTPMVFAGINDYDPRAHEGHRSITGVAERADLRGTVELAATLHPDATHLVSVSDSTITGRITQREFDRQIADLTSDIELIRLAGLSQEGLAERLRSIPAKSIVVNLSLFRTSDGTVFSEAEAGRFIAEHTQSPVYTAWDVFIGGGLVGGLVVSARGQAQTQAEMIARILRGEPADSIPVVADSPNRFIFDHAALDRHGIAMSSLPPGSRIINEPQTMWYRYRNQVIAGAATIIVLGVLVTVLLINIVRRRVAEGRLTRSEHRYRRMFETLHDVYAEVQKSDGRIITVSPSIRKFGYEPSRLVGAQISALRVDPDAQQKLVNRLESEVTVDDYELEIHTADGRPVTVSISARLEGLSADEERIVGTIRDMSERKSIEEELRRLHKAVEEAGHAVYITDVNGTINYVNPAFERITGYSREEAIGGNPRLVKSGRMPDDYYAGLYEAIQAGGTWQEQIVNRRKDGTLYYANQTIAPVLNDRSEIEWFVAVQTDETDRVENERQYRLLAENATDMISQHSADGTYTYVSPACRYLLGYEPEELIGLNSYDLFHPEDVAKIQESHDTILSGPEITYVTYRIRREDGTYTWFESTNKTIWDEDSQSVSAIVAVSRDVTERIHIQERLKEAKAQAESASQAKSEFLANVSHEIRTPLHAIMGFGELLRRRTSDATAHHYIGTIEESAQTLLQLISDILDLSKVEAGHLDISPEFEDPRELVAAVIALFAPQSQDAGIELTSSVADDLPALLYFDKARLRQILVNLVGNAIKFTERGSIEIALEPSEDDGFNLELTVTDTGIGMSEATQAHMFEPFSQGRSDTGRTYGGTGLGLAITKRLVERMDGSIEVSSSEGEGTRFVVRLPSLPCRHETPSRTEPDVAGPAAATPTAERPAPATPDEAARVPASEFAELPDEERERLRQAIKDRVRPQWRRTQEVKMRDDIVGFAERIESLGGEFGVQALARNGHDLAEAAREFDVEAMEQGLDRFRDLARALDVELDPAMEPAPNGDEKG